MRMPAFGRTPVPLIAAVLLLSAMLAYKLWAPTGDEVPVWRLQPDDAQLVAEGKEIYAAQCASCHGANLEGESNWQQRNPSGLLPAPPHDETGHTWHHPDKDIFNVTKFGPQFAAGPDYKSAMPAFEGTLTDREIVAALSYIKAQWPEKVRETHDEINRRAARQ